MLGIITVNYNSDDMIKKLYEDLIKQDYDNWVLIIVDNNSKQESIFNIEQMISNDTKVILINNSENLGFAKGNNIGVEYLNKKFSLKVEKVLFINPDIRITEREYLSKALHIMDKEKADFFSGGIITEDGGEDLPLFKQKTYLRTLLHIGNNGRVDKFLNKINSQKKMGLVFGLNGACFFADINSFLKVGMFDPNTFLYYEEDILFSKANNQNMKILYYPIIKVMHHKSKVMKRNISIYRKKKIVFESEKYYLKEILKINNFLYYIFILERSLELLLLKYITRNKVVK